MFAMKWFKENFAFFLCAALLYVLLRTIAGGGGAVQNEIVSFERAKTLYAELGGKGNVPVIMFATDWCGYCRALESDLKAANLQHVRVDIENNERAATAFREIVGSISKGVPQTLVGTTLVAGYQPEVIIQLAGELEKKVPDGNGSGAIMAQAR
jgi:glutaredoxin